MQKEIPYSLIIWENGRQLPFPDSVKDLIKDVDWQLFEWHCYGLPIQFAKYNVSDGKNLYLVELPDTTIKIEKDTSFTGKVTFAGFFLSSKEGDDNCFVSFVSTILNGEIISVELDNILFQDSKIYKEANDAFEKNLKRNIRISNSWWYKFLYIPWYTFIRVTLYCFSTVLKVINHAAISVASFLTPL